MIDYRHRAKRVKQKLFHRQNGRCAYCDKEISLEEATVDHVIPHSVYRNENIRINLIKNKLVSCKTCNDLKGNFLVGDKLAKNKNLINGNIYDRVVEIQTMFLKVYRK